MVDLRLMRVGVEVSGKIRWYTGLRMSASGTKYSNATQNECQVTISGLSADVRDYILTETSPFNSNRKPKRLIVEAGRESIGMFRLFIGDIVSAEPSSPPDVDLQISAKTCNAQGGNIVAVSGAATMQLSAIAQRAAQDMGVGLIFEADDKAVANYSYSGPALGQVTRLQEAGEVRAFVDDETLIVRKSDAPVGGRIRILNMRSGMVGIPKATEEGVTVAFLITGEALLGGMLRLDSKFNKSLNGDYIIEQLKFDIATHEDSFFYEATCKRFNQ